MQILPPSDKRKVYDSSALVAGPGNRKGKKGGVFVQWQIGCGHDFTAGMLFGLICRGFTAFEVVGS